ncbi:uncharacterized protein PG986_009309 [Apiospora aurea]|uniref:Heterokaryon incompatibility domain-containing protein n=1 Tax=Apiospora aurea TaxID=335848 RepID=A0ABR1Q7C9_9PEZI
MDIYKDVPLLDYATPSIRLLEFNTARGNPEPLQTGFEAGSTPMCASLKTYPLKLAPAYAALSYTWGQVQNQALLTLSGSPVPLSNTLGEVFDYLLQNKQDGQPSITRLWVDGICINQQDSKEKSAQVAHMKDIYVRAERVLVWLGPTDEQAGLAFDTLERFAQDDGTSDASITLKHIESDRATERRSALEKLLQRPWFSRMWVIQEVVVARVRATGSGFYVLSDGKATRAVGIGQWRAIFHDFQDPKRDEALYIRVLIKSSSDKEATDLRDKVYALLGIASEAFSQGITVNYEDSVQNVYIDCTKHILRSRSDLRVLSIIRQKNRGSQVAGLPSWVPDWSQAMDNGGVLNRYYRFLWDRLFKANGATQSQIGKIAAVFSLESLLPTNGPNSVAMSLDWLRKLVDDLDTDAEYAPSREPTWLALFRTITADRTPASPRIDPEYGQKYFSRFNKASLPNDTINMFTSQEFWGPISGSLKAIITGKVLFVSSTGYLGLTEEGCCSGDTICVFMGGEVPFVMREKSCGLFYFHGEAYVHGIMDGEALGGEPKRDLASMGLAETIEGFIAQTEGYPGRIRELFEIQRHDRNAKSKATFLDPKFEGARCDNILKSILEDDAFVDPRNNLCLWVRPPPEIIEAIIEAQRELRNMVPDGFWMAPSGSMHMTLLEIVHSETPEKLRDAVARLQPSFQQLTDFVRLHPVKLGRPQLNYDEGTVSMTVVPEGDSEYTYLHLRRDLARLCRDKGVEAASRYFTTSSHVTIARIVNDEVLSNLPSRQMWVTKIESINGQLRKQLWPHHQESPTAGEWLIGGEQGIEIRTGRLWYGGGETI